MKLFFREKGDKNLPPLIILHGLWGASDNWLPVARLLAEHFHIILPDCRNHGNSPHSSEHHYPTLVNDLKEFIECLNLAVKPYLAGHSMGGKVVMQLLLHEPQIAEKAAILDISPKTYTCDGNQWHEHLAKFMIQNPLSTYTRRAEVHDLIRRHFSTEQECQLLYKNLRKKNGGFEWKINASVLKNCLQELSTWPIPVGQSVFPGPVLFMKGENSAYLQTPDLKIIKSYFPQARLVSLPGASHWLHTDQPLLLSRLLSQFFNEK